MKRVIALLSCFILFVSLSPCTDEISEGSFGLTLIQNQSADDDCDDNTEDCSPFCYCCCCKIPTVQNQEELNALKKEERPFHASNTTFNIENPDYKIWQPPKV